MRARKRIQPVTNPTLDAFPVIPHNRVVGRVAGDDVRHSDTIVKFPPKHYNGNLYKISKTSMKEKENG